MSTGYRPPSREPQGRWARHIHAVRRERGWSQTRGFEAVRDGLGLSAKSRSAYIPIDEGKRQPTPAEEAVLGAVYGFPPEQEETRPAQTGETGEVAAAIRDQTVVLLGAIRARDDVIQQLLQELAEYRSAAIQAAAVERSLIEALPEALAIALATAIGATREDDREGAHLATARR